MSRQHAHLWLDKTSSSPYEMPYDVFNFRYVFIIYFHHFLSFSESVVNFMLSPSPLSLLCMLNPIFLFLLSFEPEATQNFSTTFIHKATKFWSSSKKTVSSTYWQHFTSVYTSVSSLTFTSLKFGSFLIYVTSGSACFMWRRANNESPCLMPLLIEK